MAKVSIRLAAPAAFPDDDVILITNADCDAGFRLARELIAGGNRVVVTARRPAALTRILFGQSASHVIAIAADVDDAAQRARLLQQAQNRIGCITWTVDA